MDDGSFQWDGDKATRNVAVHGITFETARSVFRDPFALEWTDTREAYGEERYVILGMVENRLLYVVYTLRGEAIRIISARGAEPQERRRYHDDNA